MINKILRFISNIFSNKVEDKKKVVECYLSTREFGDIKRRITSAKILDNKLKLGDKTAWCSTGIDWADYGIYGVDCVSDKYGDIEYKITDLALYFADSDDPNNEDGKIIWGENLYCYVNEEFFNKNKFLFDNIKKINF